MHFFYAPADILTCILSFTLPATLLYSTLSPSYNCISVLFLICLFSYLFILLYFFPPFHYVAGRDYSTVIKILDFEPGVTEKNLTIDIVDDTFLEMDETFILYLSSGAGAFLSPFAQAEVTIISNDGRCLYHYSNAG